MLDGLAVVGLRTDVGGDVAGGGKPLDDGEGGEEPCRAGEEIVVGHDMGDAVGT